MNDTGPESRPRTRDEHLFGDGPKRILSLDGGGVRGIISLAFLERIEALLAEHAGDTQGGGETRLCDYFDLIGGTSTGSIIATALALGFSTEQLIDLYLDLAPRAFIPRRWRLPLIAAKFPTEPLAKAIRLQVGDETLGSDKLNTGLAVIAKRIDTNSPWIFHNNPRSRYFDTPDDEPGAVPNKDLGLAEIVRASTAAPTYFKPEFIEVAKGIDGLFVDGGVSPHGNPALLMLMLATEPGYGYGWPAGEDKLTLISVGAGIGSTFGAATSHARQTSAQLGFKALYSMMNDSNWHTQAVLQWLGRSTQPWQIDSEMGDLSATAPFGRPMMSYERYEVLLQRKWLRDLVGRDYSDRELVALSALDRPKLVEVCLELGRAAAKTQVKKEHLGL